MTCFKVGAAAALLLLVASCAYDRADSYEMTRLAASKSVAPMDGSRRIAQQDCTKPVTVDRGTLLCR
jgi:hypothetical protein